MGQGTSTLFATIVGEELNINPSKINVIINTVHHNDFMIPVEMENKPLQYGPVTIKLQMTGNSTSTSYTYSTPKNPALPEMAAMAREQLKKAYASQHQVEVSEVNCQDGFLYANGKPRESIGRHVKQAVRVKIRNIKRKTSGFQFIGKESVGRIDIPDKVLGKTIYGYDFQAGKITNGVVKHSPYIGGSAQRIRNQEKVEKDFDVKVYKYKRLNGTVGVGIVGKNYWVCLQAKKALEVDWQGGESNLSSSDIRSKLRSRLNGVLLPVKGQFRRNLLKKSSVVYEFPYVPHAALEPLSCSADAKGNSCELWVGTQMIQAARKRAAALLKIQPSKVNVNNMNMGGSFGRRMTHEFLDDAILLSKLSNQPVKVLWSREDDFQNDTYRPASYHKITAETNGNRITSWHHQIACQSVLGSASGDIQQALPYKSPENRHYRNFVTKILNFSSLDALSVDGAKEIPYRIGGSKSWNQSGLKVDHGGLNLPVPIGFWRANGHSFNAFVVECFLDELCLQNGWDPYDFRMDNLKPESSHKTVLQLAHNNAPRKRPEAGRGYAVHSAYNTTVAVIIDARVRHREVIVDQVTLAVECGFIINPDIVESQMVSGVVWGLTAALKQKITLDNGVVQQTNFHQSDLLRMHECPRIKVHIVSSEKRPRGVGEPSVPPTAPALCNAIARAQGGKRFRQLPIEFT